MILRRRTATGPLLAMLLLAACAPPEMVTVPGGETRVGDDRGWPDERPAFVARVASFALDRDPVTVAAFARFVRERGHLTDAEKFGSGAVMEFGSGRWQLVPGADWRYPTGRQGAPARKDHPVTQVSWRDAVAYCAARGKRLPGEIEYEHAARGGVGSDRPYAFGTELQSRGRYRANLWTGVFPRYNTARDGYAGTSPAGAYGEGPLGLRDLAGNVWEWTADWYRPYAERDRPWPEGQRGEKVQRGGSFLCDTQVCRGFSATARGHATPESSHMHVGFRCARDLPRG